MRGLWWISSLAMVGAPLVVLAQTDHELERVVPSADSVDAGLFAPGPYLRALHLILNDEPEHGPGPASEASQREALRLFREALKVSQGEGAAVVRNARARHAAVLALAARVNGGREGGEAYKAAGVLAARAESLAAIPAASRTLWDEAIDSLVAVIDEAEKAHVASLDGIPTVPYVAYNACPYEGCCYRIWFADREMIARVEPDSGAARAFAIRAGDGILGITGILVTKKFGRCVLDPSPEEARAGRKPERVVLLGYEGEGFFRALDRGRLAFIECDWEKEVVEPTYDWWAMVQNRDGAVGWVVGGLREEMFFYNQDAIDFAPYYGGQDCR